MEWKHILFSICIAKNPSNAFYRLATLLAVAAPQFSPYTFLPTWSIPFSSSFLIFYHAYLMEHIQINIIKIYSSNVCVHVFNIYIQVTWLIKKRKKERRNDHYITWICRSNVFFYTCPFVHTCFAFLSHITSLMSSINLFYGLNGTLSFT